MAGTKEGGRKAAETNKQKYGKEFYARIGMLGGATKTNATHLKGFGSHRELARRAGKIGGKISKRGAR